MKPISKKKKRIRWVAAILFVLCAGFCYWSNNSIQITNYTYISEEVPEGFDGYTIVQLSDLHNKKFLNDNASLLKKVKALQPDLIVLTGDIVDNSHHTNIDKAVLFTNQVQQIAQTYYITGNHEVSLKRKEYLDFIKRMKAGGVVYLKDEIVHLKSESGETISLIGLADDSLLSPKLEENRRKGFQFCLRMSHSLSIFMRKRVWIAYSAVMHMADNSGSRFCIGDCTHRIKACSQH